MEEKEKPGLNTVLRRIVRITAYPILVLGLIFRIAIPWIKSQPLYLDKNDGYVFGTTLVVLLYIEGIKFLFDKFVKK